jgi:hypothetical protein
MRNGKKEDIDKKSSNKSLIHHTTNLRIVQLRYPAIFISICLIEPAFFELARVEKLL